MKLGVLTVPLGSMPLKEAAEYLAGLGVQALELGAAAARARRTLTRRSSLDTRTRSTK